MGLTSGVRVYCIFIRDLTCKKLSILQNHTQITEIGNTYDLNWKYRNLCDGFMKTQGANTAGLAVYRTITWNLRFWQRKQGMEEALDLLNCVAQSPYDQDKCVGLLQVLRQCVLIKVCFTSYFATSSCYFCCCFSLDFCYTWVLGLKDRVCFVYLLTWVCWELSNSWSFYGKDS